MGAKHVTPKEIVEMHRLYAELGNYTAVGKAMKPRRSGSTVSKYVQMKGVPQNVQIAVQNLMREAKR